MVKIPSFVPKEKTVPIPNGLSFNKKNNIDLKHVKEFSSYLGYKYKTSKLNFGFHNNFNKWFKFDQFYLSINIGNTI